MPQHESVLACSHEGVLQDHDVVVVTLLQKRRSIVATLGRGDERKGVLRHDSRGRHDIVTRRAVEKLYICVEMGVCWKWRDIPARACLLRSHLNVERHCPTRRPTSKNMI
jgi:hypothetical protein